MVARLVVAPEAEQDIAEAYTWYEDQRVGLGEEFLGCVFHTSRDPEKWRQRLP